MKTQIIVSVVGKDQGGFINTLTVKTKELGGRWLANKVAHLDGQVAGLLKMEIDEQKLPEFKAMMAEFTNVIADYHEAIEEASSPTKSVQLTIEGEDRSESACESYPCFGFTRSDRARVGRCAGGERCVCAAVAA